MSDRILRLQHVEVRVPDLELCTAYYTEVVGLVETAHEEGRVFLKCWDEHEHHSVVLRQAPTYGLDHMSFKVAEREDLDYYTERIEIAGITVKRHARGELGPGWSAATPRTTSPSSPGRTARCTTSPSGSTTGTGSARRPTCSPTTASPSTWPRPGTA